ETERGLHLFVHEKKTKRCFVHPSEEPVVDYRPPAGLERRGAIEHLAQGEKRRTYSYTQFLIEDALLKKKWPWSGRGLDVALEVAIQEGLMAQAESLVET